jgi:multidrug efflux system membrane fusion protein
LSSTGTRSNGSFCIAKALGIWRAADCWKQDDAHSTIPSEDVTRLRRISIALGAILGVFALYELATSVLAYTADAYVQSDLVTLAPQITGRITGVQVVDNQTVAEGDLLATIDPTPFQLAADQRRAEVDEARALVAADQDKIGSTRDALAAAASAAAYARDTQGRQTALAKSQYVSRAGLDQANDVLRRADAALDAAREAVAQAQSDATMHQAAKVRAVAALAAAEWQLSRTRLIAPTAGIVTNLTVRVGDTAQADIPLIGIVDAHAWRIIANYKQSFIRGFASGDTAWVWLDSQPWHLHRAKVASIARGISRDPAAGRLLPYVTPTTDWIRLQRRFPVTLTLVDRPEDLKLYMGADARVLILP